MQCNLHCVCVLGLGPECDEISNLKHLGRQRDDDGKQTRWTTLYMIVKKTYIVYYPSYEINAVLKCT
jgi:hypothetical protein